ncbi:hypothetical protein E2C01_047755 [Portunus trituberculatus]|uniref:Uncharacterized protein n=1 Tax=Portunus trituberculatus TaxID=210409 RepID=A0A5B7G4F2_PORTR|nr:hypothetical protein [Portunus trituberculatus]
MAHVEIETATRQPVRSEAKMSEEAIHTQHNQQKSWVEWPGTMAGVPASDRLATTIPMVFSSSVIHNREKLYR